MKKFGCWSRVLILVAYLFTSSLPIITPTTVYAEEIVSTPHRVLVLLQGIHTRSDTANCTWWMTLLPEINDLYDDIIYFSYRGLDKSYDENDTYQSIYTSRDRLYETINNYLVSHPPRQSSEFDLIGHSLGGVIALEYAKHYAFSGEHRSFVKHVVTLDSPVNGSKRAYQLRSGSLPDLKELLNIRKAILETLLNLALRLFDPRSNSQAANDLEGMYLNSAQKSVNKTSVKFMHGQGIMVRTFSSQQDLLILPEDALIEDYYVKENLGLIIPATSDCMLSWPGNVLEVFNASSIVGHNQILRSRETALKVRAFMESSPSGDPTGSVDTYFGQATFIRDVTLFDNGPALTPGQVRTKTWRVRNSGTSTWEGYKLIFTNGNQMGATSPVAIPITQPGEEREISIKIQAPNAPSRGDWQIVDREGVWIAGGGLWVKVNVQGASANIPGIEIANVEYPTNLSPGQSFRPKVTVRVNSGQLRESHGDMLLNTDGNLYGAYQHVGVVGTVNAGAEYTFEFYADHPITVPSSGGPFESKWRVWRNGAYEGPEIVIQVGSGKRPDRPKLDGPGDWHVSRDGSTPQLCVKSVAGAEYFIDVSKGHATPDSGWISSRCWTPPGLGPFTYEWRAKVRVGGLESDWSDTWRFTIESVVPSYTDFRLDPPSPSSAERVDMYVCGNREWHPWINTATDGSDSGEWKMLHPPLLEGCEPDKREQWQDWYTLPFEDGLHRMRIIVYNNDENRVFDMGSYQLNHRRPDDADLVSPIDDVWLNDRTVTFRWERATNAHGYRLYVGNTNDRNNASLFTGTFGTDAREKTITLAQDYENIWWWIETFNDVGSNCCPTGHFGIDRTAPTSAVTALDNTTPKTKFTVNWSGSDARAGVRWYDVQYRDATQNNWTDWQVNTAALGDIFTGQPGHTYCFRVRAMDVAGNWESYPGGNGDTCTYIDLGTAADETWWNEAYTHKRDLIILNNDSTALAAGYPVLLHFDASTTPTASEIFAASQSAQKGDDIRIVLDNQTELNRYVQTFTRERIDIWFSLHAGIAATPASEANRYQMYVGNSSASNPPGTINAVMPPGHDANTPGLWHFSEAVGATVQDASGNGHTGTAANMGWATGKFGPAGTFNGDNSVVNAGTSPALNAPSLSVEAWISATHITGGEQTLIRKQADDGNYIYDFLTADGKVFLRLNGGNGSVLSTTKLENHRWYHVAATYDGSNIRVYINGVLDNTVPYAVPLRYGTSTAFYIGGDGLNDNKYYEGYIQHARISNIARSAFPHGAFADVRQEPAVVANDLVARPQGGQPDLVVVGMTTINTEDGILVWATVTNQGDGATGNGFWIDLYEDYVPVGAGDTNTSAHFWVASPIEAGATISLTTLFTPTIASIAQMGAMQETTSMLYLLADSRETVADTDKSNNVSLPVELCLATADGSEPNNSVAQATSIVVDAPATTYNFHTVGDEDWYTFTATAGQIYRITTSSLGASADTYLYLYAPDGTTLLASNDDIEGSLASQIEWQAPAANEYLVVVKHWNPNVGGCATNYALSIQAGAAITAGDVNGDGEINAGDVSALVLEIFDGDGDIPTDAAGGSFPGTAGCDANQDNRCDAGDISCTILLVFDGPGACSAGNVSQQPGLSVEELEQAIPVRELYFPLISDGN